MLPTSDLFKAETSLVREDVFREMVWQFMRRSIRNGFINPVSCSVFANREQIAESIGFTNRGRAQVEDARAAMDLYRADEANWEATISSAYWPSVLPPAAYAHCYV